MIGRIFYTNFDLFEASIEKMQVIRCKDMRGQQLGVFFKVQEGFYFGFEWGKSLPFVNSTKELFDIFEHFYMTLDPSIKVEWSVERQKFSGREDA